MKIKKCLMKENITSPLLHSFPSPPSSCVSLTYVKRKKKKNSNREKWKCVMNYIKRKKKLMKENIASLFYIACLFPFSRFASIEENKSHSEKIEIYRVIYKRNNE